MLILIVFFERRLWDRNKFDMRELIVVVCVFMCMFVWNIYVDIYMGIYIVVISFFMLSLFLFYKCFLKNIVNVNI